MDWIEFGKLVGAIVAALAIAITALWRIVRPACDSFVHNCMGRNREKLKKLIDDLYAEELAQRVAKVEALAVASQQALTLAEAHTDSLRALQVAIERQGSEIKELPRIADALDAHAETFKSITQTLADVQRDLGKQGRLLGEISGFLRAQNGGKWDGVDRRQGSDL
jgi:hypothetical protein